MQNIGARIRTWREERNLSRKDLAEQAGLSVSFLAAWAAAFAAACSSLILPLAI